MSVIFVGALDDYFVKVAEELIKRGVAVSCFLDRFDNPAKKKPVFKNVQDIDARQFMYPEHIFALNQHTGEVLSEETLRVFEHAESVFLSITDRFSISLSVIVRKMLFRELLLHFYHFIRKGGYTHIIFPNAPHGGWNSVLYFVAKHFGLRTLVLEYTRINDRMVVWEDYESVKKVPVDFLQGEDQATIVARIDEELYREAFRESEWLKDSNRVNVATLQPRGLVSYALAYAQEAVRVLGSDWRLAAGQPTYAGRAPMFLNEPQHPLVTATRAFLARRQYQRLRRFYDHLARPAPAEAPYVLYFLNYQPEKTTTPLGGVFDDQILAVRTLAEALPSGWHVYVKEHPRQFSGVLDSAPFRSEAFYRRLAALPQVQLLPVDSDALALIDGAVCTATVTGSVGWQGMLAGKPCILFGVSWYSPCRSCYNVKSLTDVKAALADIAHTTPVQVKEDLLKYLAFAQHDLLLGSNNETFARRSRRSLNELAVGLAKGLFARLAPQPLYEKQYTA
ncbi:MAG: hypothetical protein A2854_04705 [Parcubacteria group bacterium RIFCSPHIGHO2_01_FULL_56_18]|nr:MAG: hypothetical protein A2854_04705 [Parcubacteria group bacterium RIFCSPHIGHO2_01_FULL_56_18]